MQQQRCTDDDPLKDSKSAAIVDLDYLPMSSRRRREVDRIFIVFFNVSSVPEFVKWKLTLESLPTRHGTLPSTAANGGRYRYDPSWSRVADDDGGLHICIPVSWKFHIFGR